MQNLCMLALLVLQSLQAYAGPHYLQYGLPKAYLQRPTTYESPRFRWWWPGGWIEPGETAAEISEIIAAGFGGAEIGDVEDSVVSDLDPRVYGWAQDRWNVGVLSAYERTAEIHGYLDYTLGPHWPTGYPNQTPDSPSTSKELVHGQVFVDAGARFNGRLPLPEAVPSGNTSGNPLDFTTPFFVALLAAKTTTVNATAEVVAFDPASVLVVNTSITIGANATEESVDWTAPDDGTYVLVAVYGRGTGQIQNLYDGSPDAPEVTYPFPAYIVDHLSKAGVQVGVEYWNEKILTPKLRALLSQVGGSFFEDSLELKLTQYWTNDFIEEFKSRRHYDLTPFLLYVLKDTNTFAGDEETGAQIENDFYRTVSDLYIDFRLGGLLDFAHSLGMKLRIQPYTAEIDSAYAASIVDIPEGESLGFGQTPDAYRILATGRDLGGKTTILSNELGAYFGLAYGVTWKLLLGTANLDMALGVSQHVIHGFPYRDSPSSVWPGFSPFTPFRGTNGFADAWGPRQPQWLFAPNASGYLANAQMILQRSDASIDVAILNQDWGVTTTWSDPTLNGAGYSYQFPTPELLMKYGATVERGRLAPDGPRYKALIINNETRMDVDTAERIVEYAQAGLPVVLIPPYPNATFSYNEDASTAQDQLYTAFSRLRELPNVAEVSVAADVSAALAQLNVAPSVIYSLPNNNSFITYRRKYDNNDLYWIHNADPEFSMTQQIGLEGAGTPYFSNLWDGSIEAIGAYSQSGDRVYINVTIAPNATAVVFLGESLFHATPLRKHITSTDCDTTVIDGIVYALTNSSCSAITSADAVVHVTASGLPSPINLSTWTLTVEDWAPAELSPNGTVTNSTETEKTLLAPVELNDLSPWSQIDSLQNASGIGSYRTSIALESNLDDLRAWMVFGEVVGTFGVKINGADVPAIDQFGSSPLDVTQYLHTGENNLEIIVATTLWNKLIAVWPEIYGGLPLQDIGLLGPVTLRFLQSKAI